MGRAKQASKTAELTAASRPDAASRLITRRILILANLLRRGAALRYRRLLDLPLAEWGVLAELGTQPPLMLNDLASSIGLDKTQLSRTVSSLVERGYVERRSNPENNREVLISLTDTGSGVYDRLILSGLAVNDALLHGVDAVELTALFSRIDDLTERAKVILQSEQARAPAEDKS